MVNKLVIIGPAWPLRGGLSAFDEKLATQFTEKGIQTRIDTFSLQYPSILFPGKSQYTTDPKPKDVNISVQRGEAVGFADNTEAESSGDDAASMD
jgi:hypothetical protein